MRCDYRDPDRDNGHRQCAEDALFQVVRTIEADAGAAYATTFSSWRCREHLPSDEPRIGSIVVTRITDAQRKRFSSRSHT